MNLIISEDIVESYYKAIEMSIEGDYLGIKDFVNKYPLEYKRLTAIHSRRSKINKSIKAMFELSNNIYWGTLTFNDDKDGNKVTSKRKEVFVWLNNLFDYFLLVEEYGEINGRYHIHFVGLLKFDKTVEDFKNHWHSREQIRRLNRDKNLGGYLCKYISKDLPRIRRNKPLVSLTKAYKKGVLFDNLGFNSIGAKYQCQKVQLITIFDDLDLEL